MTQQRRRGSTQRTPNPSLTAATTLRRQPIPGPERSPDWLRARWTRTYIDSRERVLGGHDGLERAGRRIAEMLHSGELNFEHVCHVVEVVAATRPDHARRAAENIVLRHFGSHYAALRARPA